MTRHQRICTTMVLAGASFVTMTALAQQPPATPEAAQPATTDAAPADTKKPATTAATKKKAAGRRSIVHHNQHPYPGYYQNDHTAGFRNPGGVGRYAEYYPPDNQFQNQGRDPVRVAHFDQGGGAPDRQEQLEAQQIGIQRANSIQNHIDNYARPYVGYGVGFYGGYY